MNYDQLSLKTVDGVSVSYPRNFLKRNCGLIRGALEEKIDGLVEIPFTSLELNLFLELLETRRILSTIDGTFAALVLADYFELNLTPLELNQMITDFHLKLGLENIEQADEFILEAGCKELSIPALVHLLVNRSQLLAFTGLTREERFDRFAKEFCAKTSVGVAETLRMALPLVPQIMKEIFIMILSGIPHEYPIPESYLGYARTFLPLVKGQLFKNENVAPPPPPVGPLPPWRLRPVLEDQIGDAIRQAVPMVEQMVRAQNAHAIPADAFQRIGPVVENLMRAAPPIAIPGGQIQEILQQFGPMFGQLMGAANLPPRVDPREVEANILGQLDQIMRGAGRPREDPGPD